MDHTTITNKKTANDLQAKKRGRPESDPSHLTSPNELQDLLQALRAMRAGDFSVRMGVERYAGRFAHLRLATKLALAVDFAGDAGHFRGEHAKLPDHRVHDGSGFMKGDREKCLDAGASDYLAKPVNTEQLLSALPSWLHR